MSNRPFRIAARLLIGWIYLAAVSFGCSSQSSPEILVFAAASLTDVLSEIGESYETQTETDVSFSLAGSQILAQQIAAGAPADLFISAGVFPIEFLRDVDALDSDAVNIVSNKLVVATLGDRANIESVQQLTAASNLRVAAADPSLAPAGRYTQEALTNLGLWEELAGHVVLGSDVRATLAYLESGNAEFAFVYQTDALTVDNVRILDIVPIESYSPIVYPAAIVKNSDDRSQALDFLNFLQGETSHRIFRKHGFDPL